MGQDNIHHFQTGKFGNRNKVSSYWIIDWLVYWFLAPRGRSMKGSWGGGGGGANFGKFKGKVGSKIFRFFFDFRYFSLREGQEEGNSKIFRFFQNFSFFHTNSEIHYLRPLRFVPFISGKSATLIPWNWFQYLWFSWFSGRRQHWYRGKRSYPLPVPGPSSYKSPHGREWGLPYYF